MRSQCPTNPPLSLTTLPSTAPIPVLLLCREFPTIMLFDRAREAGEGECDLSTPEDSGLCGSPFVPPRAAESSGESEWRFGEVPVLVGSYTVVGSDRFAVGSRTVGWVALTKVGGLGG